MTAPESIPTGVDAQNPWPGLESFKEGDAFFFHGREQESAELLRLIKRETLTVLFSRSGLGKTSLLRAGVFPKLREQECLPVYVRLDYSLIAEPLADQVMTAISQAVIESECEAPERVPEQKLWEYFHGRNADFWSKKNVPLMPILVFDQFEEIFTLGRRTEVQSARSEFFLKELSDLIENRPPAELREKLEEDGTEAATYAFGKEVCKVVLSLREDYLPELETLRPLIPSVMSNRLRIQPLSGEQALDVVLKAGEKVVTPPVANQIVAFVAGAADHSSSNGDAPSPLTNHDIDPALLSLFCRELNDRRIRLGQETITANLLEGSSKEILTKFYEDSIGALPEQSRQNAREFVEDCLLTRLGHRDNMALDNALDKPGITQEVIDELISRRLIRLDERQTGTPRVELAHDVLTGVLVVSRDARHAERDRAAAEARAAEEHERAERERLEKETWNKRADELIEVIIYNLSGNLSTTGQLQPLTDLNDAIIKYFERFDEDERTPTLKWNHAVALQSRGSIRMDAGKVSEAFDAQSGSLKIFRELAAEPSASDAHRNAVAAQCSYLANVLLVQGDSPAALELLREAFAITEELMAKADPRPYLASNLAYFRDRIADVLRFQGKLDEAMNLYRESLKEREARKLAGGEPVEEGVKRELSDSYLSIGDSLRVQGSLGEALKHFKDSLEIRKQLADEKKYDVAHQQNLSQSYDRVGESLQAAGRMDDALEAFKLSDEIFQKLIVLDSTNSSANWKRNYSVTRMRLANIQSLAGFTETAAAVFSEALGQRQSLADIDATSADALEDLAEAHMRVGDSEVWYGKLNEAWENYQRAFEIRAAFAEKEPANAERQARLADSIDREGDLLCARANFAEALSQYEQSRAIREQLAQQDRTNLSREADLAASIEKIGDAQKGLFQFQPAHDSFTRALEKRQALCLSDPENAQWQALLAVSLRKVAETCVSLGELQRALNYFVESTSILSKLTEVAEQYAEWMSYLADLLCAFALARRINGEPELALAGLRPTIEVREAIAGMDVNNVKRQAELAWTLYLAASTIFQMEPESKDEANGFLKRAHEIMLKCSQTAELTREQADWLAEIGIETRTHGLAETTETVFTTKVAPASATEAVESDS